MEPYYKGMWNENDRISGNLDTNVRITVNNTLVKEVDIFIWEVKQIQSTK
jgi:hypothetical protein